VDHKVRLDLSEKRPFVATGIRNQDHVECSLVATPTTPSDTIYIVISLLTLCVIPAALEPSNSLRCSL
jgi:hypothetical protein